MGFDPTNVPALLLLLFCYYFGAAVDLQVTVNDRNDLVLHGKKISVRAVTRRPPRAAALPV